MFVALGDDPASTLESKDHRLADAALHHGRVDHAIAKWFPLGGEVRQGRRQNRPAAHAGSSPVSRLRLMHEGLSSTAPTNSKSEGSVSTYGEYRRDR